MSYSQILRTVAVGLFTAVLTLACSDQDAADGNATLQISGGGPDTVAQQLVAELLSVPSADVTVISSEARQFNDSSLGCPEPGMSYMQALTPGHRIIVEADGRRFDIRVSGGHGKICHRQKPGKKPSKPAQTAPASASIDIARENLAEILQTDTEQITILDVRPYDAQQPIAGCKPECESNVRCGYMIGLFHDGRRYDFHATENSAEPCPPILTM